MPTIWPVNTLCDAGVGVPQPLRGLDKGRGLRCDLRPQVSFLKSLPQFRILKGFAHEPLPETVECIRHAIRVDVGFAQPGSKQWRIADAPGRDTQDLVDQLPGGP